MFTQNQLSNLPEDPEAAFVIVEDLARAYMLQNRDNETDVVEREYVAAMLAFIHEYDIEIEIDDNVPDDRDFWMYIKRFMRQIDYQKNAFRFRGIKKRVAHPAIVYLSEEFRDEIHGHIATIRKIINAAEMKEQKRNSLFKRLNSFAGEVDKSTTNLEDFTSVWLDVTAAAGEGAENLEPAVKKFERIMDALAKVRGKNNSGEIPPPAKRRMITGPPTEEDANNSGSMEDEIPF